ncbi:phosphate ABC transporter ATP-binding protein PstB [Amylolactobacillus amylophilus]|uniref:phosphate ABC transporter ATP-binding protein PstB n=1 Tax=Amylolactobacillus amylophilus TaxID=1603 RepID=UPI000A866284|nr:phosphate ABC transporter ATP-binding protein PstB [Amylolactobacillus amylophilus]
MTEEKQTKAIIDLAKLNKEIAVETHDLHVYYGEKDAIHGVSLQFERNKITSLIGASGSGKSTYLRSINRMNDNIPHTKVEGEIMYRGLDINSDAIDVYEMRKHIGMVFQRPILSQSRSTTTSRLPPNVMVCMTKKALDELVETTLKQAALWNQVKDDLGQSALALSGGQQQRLCIARAIAMKPDILLMDEPASALDPISAGTVEETMMDLKANYTIIIVTHNMQQAARISDYTCFFHLGDAVEYDETRKIFTTPQVQLTEDYVSGRFG